MKCFVRYSASVVHSAWPS